MVFFRRSSLQTPPPKFRQMLKIKWFLKASLVLIYFIQLTPLSKYKTVLFQLINIGSHYQYGNDDHAEFLCVVSREYPHTASQDKLQEPTDRAKVTARILLSILFTLSSAQHINNPSDTTLCSGLLLWSCNCRWRDKYLLLCAEGWGLLSRKHLATISIIF